ncbi:acyltransferase family protein [Labrys neptuniae]
MQNPRNLWANAQVMRLFAAFLIVYIHLEATLEEVGLNENFVEIFRIGTDCFLVLTAFLSVYKNPFHREQPKDWLWKRLIRIVPLYWILTVAAFFLKNNLLPASHHNTLDQLIKSLLFIPYGPRPILYPGWSLALIIEFAVLFALSHAVFPRKGGLVASVAAGGLGVLGWLLAPENPVWAIYTHPMLIDFFFGGMLAMVIKRVERAPSFWLVLSGVVSFGCAGIGLILSRHASPDLPRAATLGIPALLIVAGCLMLECGEICVESPWILTAARYTFGVYLGHAFWDVGAAELAKHISVSATIALLIVTPIPVSLIAVALYHFVELPVRRLTDRLPPWFVMPSARAKNSATVRPLDL